VGGGSRRKAGTDRQLNEAFGSMWVVSSIRALTSDSLTDPDRYAYCVQGLGLDISKVNVNGGAM